MSKQAFLLPKRHIPPQINDHNFPIYDNSDFICQCHFQRLGNCVAQIDWAILLLMLLLPPNPKIAWPSYENQPSFICFTDSIGNNPRIVLLFPFTIQILPCARFLHAGCVWPLTRLMTQKILYKILPLPPNKRIKCLFNLLTGCTKVLVHNLDPNPPKESSVEPKMSLQHIINCVRSA